MKRRERCVRAHARSCFVHVCVCVHVRGAQRNAMPMAVRTTPLTASSTLATVRPGTRAGKRGKEERRGRREQASVDACALRSFSHCPSPSPPPSLPLMLHGRVDRPTYQRPFQTETRDKLHSGPVIAAQPTKHHQRVRVNTRRKQHQQCDTLHPPSFQLPQLPAFDRTTDPDHPLSPIAFTHRLRQESGG